MPALTAPALTPALRRLLIAGADAGIERAEPALSSADLESLVATARGDASAAPGLSPHRAIRLLAVASPALATPLLDELACSSAATITDRVAALRGLGRVATGEAQRLLLRHAGDPTSPRLQQAALASLGLFADRSALDALARVPEPFDAAVRRQLAFTRALLAHRAGLVDTLATDTQGIRRTTGDTGHSTGISLKLQSADATRADMARLRGSKYGIALAERAYTLRCGKAHWSVFGNRGLGPSITANDLLFKRPWIVALLARWMPPDATAVTQHVVLSSPAGRTVRLQIFRADGELVYAGWGEPRGAGLYVEIADVDRPQTAPTFLAATMDAEGVRLETASTSMTRIATRLAEPVKVD
jgi:hypothetical protein